MPDRRPRRPPSLAERLADLGADRVAAAEGRSVILHAASHGTGRAARRARPAGRPRRDRPRARARPPASVCRSAGGTSSATRTRGVIDREALRGRGDFAADLLALADATQLDPAARAELAAGLVSEAPRAFSAVLDGIVGDDERFARLVEEATTVALDSVAGDEP